MPMMPKANGSCVWSARRSEVPAPPPRRKQGLQVSGAAPAAVAEHKALCDCHSTTIARRKNVAQMTS